MSALARIEPQQPVLGLELPENTSFDEWWSTLVNLCDAGEKLKWCIGDVWAFGEHRYGERAKAAASGGVGGYTFQALVDMGSVCRAYETKRRRLVLSFTHHREAAPIARENPDLADEMLSRAAECRWSKDDLRREVRALQSGDAPADVSAEPRPHLEADANAVKWADAVIEMYQKWSLGDPPGEREEALYQGALDFARTARVNYRPVPDDFAVYFREHGRLACEDRYNARRTTVDRWLLESGKAKLLRERASFVAFGRGGRKAGPEQSVTIPEADPQTHAIAGRAAEFLRHPSRGAWVVYSHPTMPDHWVRGNARMNSEALIDFAERKGFDIEAALAEIQAEAV